MGLSSLPPLPGLTYTRTVFLSSGTLTLPQSNINEFDCVLVAGGSGGARAGGLVNRWPSGGIGQFNYYYNVFCTKGTTLTITIGAGAAGGTSAVTYGSVGNASTITNIVGNGVTNSLSSGSPSGGVPNLLGTRNSPLPYAAGAQQRLGSGNSGSTTQYGAIMVGVNSFGTGGGINNANTPVPQAIFSNNISFRTTPGYVGSWSAGGGGVMPLLGTFLHASVGSSGANGPTGTGGSCIANTFFAGPGGSGSAYANGSDAKGGGGGAGGSSGSATFAGAGGNGAVNSGGGGGGGGKNTNTAANTGNGGNGGSGFVIIGFWG